MRKMKIAFAAAAVALAVAAPASAQNVASNNGIWWGGPAGAPALTFMNPLTTVYGRIGLSYSFMDSSAGGPPFPLNTPPFTNATAHPADAWGGDLAIGFRLAPAIRYDLSLSGIFNTQTTWSHPLFPFSMGHARVASAQLLNNFYLDIAPIFGGLGRFNPYIMAGLGVAWNTVGETVGFGGVIGQPLFIGNTRTAFAWTAGAGVQYQIVNNLILDVSYRYLDAGRAQTTFGFVAIPGFVQTSAQIQAHQIHVGLVIPVDGLIRGFGN